MSVGVLSSVVPFAAIVPTTAPASSATLVMATAVTTLAANALLLVPFRPEIGFSTRAVRLCRPAASAVVV